MYVLIFTWSPKVKFLMYLFSSREIHLDQNSIFLQNTCSIEKPVLDVTFAPAVVGLRQGYLLCE